MNKTFNLLPLIFSCITATALIGMESASSQPNSPTFEQNQDMLEFACQRYLNIGISKLGQSFTACEEQFPQHAQLAKLYIYFQMNCAERIAQEELLLRAFNVAQLLTQYPTPLPQSLPAIQDGLRAKHPRPHTLAIHNIIEQIRMLQYKTANQIYELYDKLQRIDQLTEQERKTLVLTLILEEHIPFLEYVRTYITTNNLQINMPQHRFGSYYDQWRKNREAAYDELTTSIQARSITAARIWLEYHRLNPNHILEGPTTPLSIAVMRGSVPIIDMLLRHGADPQIVIACRKTVNHHIDMLPAISYEEWLTPQIAAWEKAKMAEWENTPISKEEKANMRIEKETELFGVWDTQQTAKYWYQEETTTSACQIAQDILGNEDLSPDTRETYINILSLLKRYQRPTVRLTSIEKSATTTSSSGRTAEPPPLHRNALANSSYRLISGTVRTSSHIPNNTAITHVPVVEASCSCHPITCDIM